jgi:hypothetical protein
MNIEGKEYFGNVIRLKNPKLTVEQEYNSYTKICTLYCEIKNLARDVLLFPHLNPKNTKKTIEEKLKEIKKLSAGSFQ